MSRVLAGVLAVAICVSACWAADETPAKKTAHQKSAITSAQQLQQMQALLKQQRQQIAKLQALLEQSRQARQKLSADIQQNSLQAQDAQQRATSVQQMANGLSGQVTKTPLENPEPKAAAK